VNTVLR